MLIIPAIDLRGGRCVRLFEGKRGTERQVAEDAVAQAKTFERAGVQRLHVVDLDGAFDGTPRNTELIGRIAKAVRLPVQVGGGLRTLDAVEAVLDTGASHAILGTLLAEDPDLFGAICARFPGRVIAGIDARDGRVATQGWEAISPLTALEAARAAEAAGAAAVITTDIARDGMGTGVNVDDTRALASAVRIPVLASGGVSGIDDVRRLVGTNIAGVIVGRAIYDGALDLEEALRVAAGG